jgi:hypothetical protein
MTAPPATWPMPSCPARHGHGTDIRTGGFTLVADDHDTGTGPPITEIFAFFHIPASPKTTLLPAEVPLPAT